MISPDSLKKAYITGKYYRQSNERRQIDFLFLCIYINDTMGENKESLQCLKCYTLNSKDSQFCSKCGNALEEEHETLSYGNQENSLRDRDIHFEPGQIFDGRYRIIEKIGHGGMGIVYKAEDTELNITVALKIIRPVYSSDSRFIEQFKKETLTARSVSNKNVIRIHDLGEANNTKYISMEYIKGQNLRDLIKTSGSLSIDTAVNLSRQLCEAIGAAHQKGIVHQDLKPSNIMVDGAGQAYVMDFGLARSFYRTEGGAEKSLTGTPKYMSPEQVKMEKIDQRADIYALGTIMYEMLTGRHPFKAESPEEFMQMHVEKSPVPPSRQNPRIRSQLEKIILKCLEKDKAKRYQNSEEILADLRDFIKAKPAAFILWLKKYWFLPAGAAVVMIFALVIFMGRPHATRTLSKGKRISLAVAYLTNNSGNTDLDYIGRTFSELLIADLLQSKYVRVITGAQLYGILEELGYLEKVSYSPDELQRVAFQGSADYILAGHFTMAGEILRVDTILYDARIMEPIGSESVEGRGGDNIFPMVDRLSQMIKRDFNISQEDIYADIDKDVMSITTSSPAALEHFIEGKRLFHIGKYQESTERMLKAISIDAEFAMAYLALFWDYEYLGQPEKSKEFLDKARSLTHRVSEREYYMIQGATARPDKAIESYNKILELYPDDLSANGLIGALYRNMEEWDKAFERFQKVVEIEKNQATAFENLAYIHMARGDYVKAREILDANRNIFENPADHYFRRGMCFLCEGQFDLALEEAAAIQKLSPESFQGLELEGYIHLIKGDMDSATQSFHRMVESRDIYEQFLGHFWQSFLFLTQLNFGRLEEEIRLGLEHSRQVNLQIGTFNFKIISAYFCLERNRNAEALEMAHQAVEAAHEIGYNVYQNLALHMRGLAYVGTNNITDAKATAEKLKEQIEESGHRKRLRHYHHLKGKIAWAEENFQEAVEEYETAVSLLPHEYSIFDTHVLYLDSLAFAYYGNGDLEKALETYERISSLKTGRLRWGNKYVLSFYWLGKIYQETNESQKARDAYTKFLDKCRQADPEIPEIEEAQNKLDEFAKSD
jgi:serine/threonine protein kinase/tetratricopeptide (TPR) repeat protein